MGATIGTTSGQHNTTIMEVTITLNNSRWDDAKRTLLREAIIALLKVAGIRIT